MDPFTLSLGASVLSAGASWWNRHEQARQLRRETAEEVRRFERGAARTVGEARAAGAASGVEVESESLQGFIKDMEAEFRRRADFMRRSGSRAAGAAGLSADLGLVGDLGASVFKFGQNNNWWRG